MLSGNPSTTIVLQSFKYLHLLQIIKCNHFKVLSSTYNSLPKFSLQPITHCNICCPFIFANSSPSHIRSTWSSSQFTQFYSSVPKFLKSHRTSTVERSSSWILQILCSSNYFVMQTSSSSFIYHSYNFLNKIKVHLLKNSCPHISIPPPSYYSQHRDRP